MRFFGPPDSPDLIPSQEPLCQQIVNQLLDEAWEKAASNGRLDVVGDFAYPLPANVICRIMGVPIQDEPLFHTWVADVTAGIFDLGPDIHTKEGQVRRARGEANRDPRRFPDPNTFNPARADNEHVGFGRGIHICFGGPLARLEVNTAFEAFLRRVDNPRLVEDPPPYRISQVFRGPQRLLVDYDEIWP